MRQKSRVEKGRLRPRLLISAPQLLTCVTLLPNLHVFPVQWRENNNALPYRVVIRMKQICKWFKEPLGWPPTCMTRLGVVLQNQRSLVLFHAWVAG